MCLKTFFIVMLACVATTDVAIASPKYGRVKLSDIKTLSFIDARMTVAKRDDLRPEPELQCTSGKLCSAYKDDLPSSAFCTQDTESHTWDCKFETGDIKIADSDVVCEGFDGPDDDHVVAGSCMLLYSVELYSKTFICRPGEPCTGLSTVCPPTECDADSENKTPSDSHPCVTLNDTCPDRNFFDSSSDDVQSNNNEDVRNDASTAVTIELMTKKDLEMFRQGIVDETRRDVRSFTKNIVTNMDAMLKETNNKHDSLVKKIRGWMQDEVTKRLFRFISAWIAVWIIGMLLYVTVIKQWPTKIANGMRYVIGGFFGTIGTVLLFVFGECLRSMPDDLTHEPRAPREQECTCSPEDNRDTPTTTQSAPNLEHVEEYTREPPSQRVPEREPSPPRSSRVWHNRYFQRSSGPHRRDSSPAPKRKRVQHVKANTFVR